MDILELGDEELVNILQSFETEKNTKKAAKVINEMLEGYFCSMSVFNLSKKVLTETEIHVLEKGSGFVPSPTKINETDLRTDFNEFARKMWLSGFSITSLLKTLVKHQHSVLSRIGAHLRDTLL